LEDYAKALVDSLWNKLNNALAATGGSCTWLGKDQTCRDDHNCCSGKCSRCKCRGTG